jgi:hypothetical protein
MRERMPAAAASGLAKSARCRDFAGGVGTKGVPIINPDASGAGRTKGTVSSVGVSTCGYIVTWT